MAPARSNRRKGFARIQVVHSIEMSHELNRSVIDSDAGKVMSIDVGTSGVRAALFDEQGNQIEGAQALRQRRGGDFVELDPDLLVDEVERTLDELLERCGLPAGKSERTGRLPAVGPILANAISTFWHSLMGVDARGKPTTPLLTWADTRAVAQAKELRAEFDQNEIHARTGCRLHPSYWPAKLRWLKAEHPRKFNATSKWLGFGEYLCLRLFGEMAASVSMAS